MVGFWTLLSRRGEPSRRVRRLMVAASIIAVPLAWWVPALIIPTLDWHGGLEFLTFVAWLVIVTFPLLVLQEFRRNVIRRDDADERERRRRDEAFRLSYWAIVWGLLLVPLALAINGLAGIVDIDWFLLYWPLVWYAVFLPYLVLAWREPDAVE